MKMIQMKKMKTKTKHKLSEVVKMTTVQLKVEIVGYNNQVPVRVDQHNSRSHKTLTSRVYKVT